MKNNAASAQQSIWKFYAQKAKNIFSQVADELRVYEEYSRYTQNSSNGGDYTFWCDIAFVQYGDVVICQVWADWSCDICYRTAGYAGGGQTGIYKMDAEKFWNHFDDFFKHPKKEWGINYVKKYALDKADAQRIDEKDMGSEIILAMQKAGLSMDCFKI